MAEARPRVRELTPTGCIGLPTIMVVRNLNSFRSSWCAYFGHGNSTQQFKPPPQRVLAPVAFMTRKHDKRGYRRGMAELIESRTQLGLHCLDGTIRYGDTHAARRTSRTVRCGGGRRPDQSGSLAAR